MDQNQWNALNQMLNQQRKPNQPVATAKAATGRQQTPGTVQTRVISAGSSATAAATQRGGARQQLNGAQQAESGVVKSLLTGRQYAQSVLRPDVGRATQAAKAAPAKAAAQKQQVSLLTSNWQQQQQTVDAASIAADTQQLVLSGLPENIGPGESLYVVVDGVTYQIDSSNAELLAAAAAGGTSGGTSVLPLGSRISLEDLANISAEQQTLSLDYQAAAAANEMAVSAADVKLEMQSVGASEASALQQMDGQQFLEAHGATSTAGGGTEPMQIIILPADGSDMKGADFKVGSQDFILQPGQQLPPELQEMVARGLPIDFSNYEFVIQEEDGSSAHDGSGATASYLSASQQLASGGGDATSVMVSLSGAGGGNNDDILTMLAEASSHQGHGALQWTTGVTSSMPIIDEDDGEFVYVMTSVESGGAGEPGVVSVARPVMESGFLAAFTDFLSGAKAETLSSVANSTVIRKQPQLPIAYVPEPSRKSAASAQQHGDKSKTPMTVVFGEGGQQQMVYVNEGNTPSGRGRGRGRGRPPSQIVVQKFAGRSGLTPQKSDEAERTPGVGVSVTKEHIRQSIIAKKKKVPTATLR